jgi:glycosyltransferase involved in cell wall biosynthesis
VTEEEKNNARKANEYQSNQDKPLTIAFVIDNISSRGNGTSNSALQFTEELERQGHTVRLVGVGAPQYSAKVNRIPLVSYIANKQQWVFAQSNEELFHAAFEGADTVHILFPFLFGKTALKVARQMGIPVTAAFHLQPENITYSIGLQRMPGLARAIYYFLRKLFYAHVDHLHVPSGLGAELLKKHGYKNTMHVISNGYEPRFAPASSGQGEQNESSELVKNSGPRAEDSLFHIVASGRLSNEKDHETLIQAIALSRHADEIRLSIAGTGPLKRKLTRLAKKSLVNPADIGFHRNSQMPDFLRSGDLMVHPSIADLESISVIEGIACGLVPVIADSPLSAAGQFSLTEQSSFPVGDAQALADRIDWWIEHPQERAQWSAVYAQHTKETYSLEASVRKFVAMEREAIADDF